MNKGMKYEHLITEWTQLYNEGKSFREISTAYGCNKSTVARTLKGHVEKRPKSKWDQYAQKWFDLYANHAYLKTDIAKQHGTSITVVSRVLKTMGVEPDTESSSKLKKYTHLVGDFIQEYQSGMSLSEIGQKHGINKQTILNYLRDEGIEVRDYAESSRKYPLRDNYFDQVDTKEKAFFLGIVFAIGTTIDLHKSQCLNLSTHMSKEILLKMVVKELRGEENYSGMATGKDDDILRIRLHSKHLFERLRELGLNNRNETIFPSIPKELLSSFILGYMQDRATYKPKRNDLYIYGNDLFIDQLSKVLKQIVAKDKVFCKEGDTFVAIYDNREIKKLEDWLGIPASIKLH